jgi:hypothetical protein
LVIDGHRRALQDILALTVDDCRFGNWKLETGIWKPELDKGENSDFKHKIAVWQGYDLSTPSLTPP